MSVSETHAYSIPGSLPALTEPCPMCRSNWDRFYERVAKAKENSSRSDPLGVHGVEALSGLLGSLKNCRTCRDTGEAPTEFGQQIIALVRTFVMDEGAGE